MQRGPFTVGKKKDKEKNNSNDRPGRKELVRELELLREQNEALRARLERIGEIASADLEADANEALLPAPDSQDA